MYINRKRAKENVKNVVNVNFININYDGTTRREHKISE